MIGALVRPWQQAMTSYCTCLASFKSVNCRSKTLRPCHELTNGHHAEPTRFLKSLWNVDVNWYKKCLIWSSIKETPISFCKGFFVIYCYKMRCAILCGELFPPYDVTVLKVGVASFSASSGRMRYFRDFIQGLQWWLFFIVIFV